VDLTFNRNESRLKYSDLDEYVGHDGAGSQPGARSGTPPACGVRAAAPPEGGAADLELFATVGEVLRSTSREIAVGRCRF